MLELINTSLPNGLIAGTHGFATVAMTKGVSDVLRSRLEALCAYTHRTSVHDASYFSQNPVNWFHVTLPQGEHVIGRVSPSEFDYTGRTNRLARLRIFNTTEMPDVGGATVLIKEKAWFSQAWQGDPRYLDEDRNTCGRLRMLTPTSSWTVPTWNEVFGSQGSRMAQRVAWQLEKNIAVGGKTIYFKTSSAWDASGERLLGLFSEVIDLLPVGTRSKVTFSTYPVSLPGGTGCNLRGVYDRDKVFDAASATQAWVDCENGKIVNLEMLPSVQAEEPKSCTPKPLSSVNLAGASGRPGFQPSTSISRGGPSSPRQNAYQSFLQPQKKGPVPVVVGIFIATVVLAVGLFFIKIQSNKKQKPESGAEEQEIKNLESEREQPAQCEKGRAESPRKAETERIASEERKRQEAAAKEKARREADEAQKKQEKENAAKAAEAAARREAAQAKKDAESRQKARTAFMTADLAGRGGPPKPKTGLARALDKPLEIKVFYYKGMSLTNETAGFKPITDPVNRKKITDYALWVGEPKLKTASIAGSPVVIWVSEDKSWYDWSQHETKRTQWFKGHDSHDLQLDCFGVSEEVYSAWNSKKPVTYIVSWGEEEGQSTEWPTREFKVKDAVDVVCKAEIARLKAAVEKAKKEIQDNDAAIEKVAKEKAAFDEQIAEYAVETNKLETLKTELKNLRDDRQAKKKRKEIDKKAEEFKKSLRELNTKIGDQEKVVGKFGIKSIEIQATQKKYKLEQLEKDAKKLKDKLEKKQIVYDAAIKDPEREKLIRESLFMVTVKGGN